MEVFVVNQLGDIDDGDRSNGLTTLSRSQSQFETSVAAALAKRDRHQKS